MPAVKAAAPTYGRKKFDDEDVEDDIKDDWDAEDEEPEKPDVTLLQPIKKKSTVKQKIREREERERERAALGLSSEDEEDDEEDPLERRRREKEAQIKADVDNAANLLGTSKIGADDEVLSAALKPKKLSTKEEWEQFSEAVYQKIIKEHAGKAGYEKNFVPHFCKLLAEQMRDVDCRKQSLQWKNVADEKTKAEKEKKAGGGRKVAPKPKTVGTASAKNTVDLRAYGNEALDDGDDLDFM